MAETNFSLCFYGVTVKGTVRRYGHASFYYLDEVNGIPIQDEDPLQGKECVKLYCKKFSETNSHSDAVRQMMYELWKKNTP